MEPASEPEQPCAVEWTEPAIRDMMALDKGIARRVQKALDRFVETVPSV
jgi:hypothetical protein